MRATSTRTNIGIAGPSTIDFTSNVHDAGHGNGSFTYRRAEATSFRVPISPMRCPPHATSAEITDRRSEVLPGYWAVTQETQQYKGNYGPFAGGGNDTDGVLGFPAFPGSSERPARAVAAASRRAKASPARLWLPVENRDAEGEKPMPDFLKTLFVNPPTFEGYDGGAGSRYQCRREVRSFWYPTWLAQPAAMVPGSRLDRCASRRSDASIRWRRSQKSTSASSCTRARRPSTTMRGSRHA